MLDDAFREGEFDLKTRVAIRWSHVRIDESPRNVARPRHALIAVRTNRTTELGIHGWSSRLPYWSAPAGNGR